MKRSSLPAAPEPAANSSSASNAIADPSLVVPTGPGIQEFAAGIGAPTLYVSPMAPPSGRGTLIDPTSLAHALKVAPANAVIQLDPGTYPQVSDQQVHPGWITITGRGDAIPPVIQGAMLAGAQWLRFVDVHFTAGVQIRDSLDWRVAEKQPAEHIQIDNSEIECGSTTAARQTNGLMVRGASQDVLITGDYVHNCVVGFASVAQDPVSSNIRLEHNLFQYFPGDAIDLGGMSGVTIYDNIIRDIADPQNFYHDDGIQFFGNVEHVQILDNVLANSRNQLIFIQDAVKSLTTGSSINSDILIAHNLIYGAGSWAVQAQGALNTRFIDNTMWSNHYGSLLLRISPYTAIAPTDTVLVGNVVQGYGQQEVTPEVSVDNLIDAAPPSPLPTVPSSDLKSVDPGFVAAEAGDFEPTAASPTYSTAAPVPAGAASSLLSTPDQGFDIFGRPVPAQANYGAVQAGGSILSYGAPVYGPSPLS